MGKRGPKKGHGGVPKKEINWDDFEKLCHISCTLREIASFFNCSEDTIENRVKEKWGETFSEFYSKKASGGAVSLRRRQHEVAMSGDRTMLIWLGKQRLGQTDKQSTTHDITGTAAETMAEFVARITGK